MQETVLCCIAGPLMNFVFTPAIMIFNSTLKNATRFICYCFMSNKLHNELKKEFQLERLILFSDAVFAIAITLLVIEIKIPEVHENVSDKVLLHELKHLVPKFIGFLISFMLIGLYWTIHHRMFGFVTNYNKRLVV